jgi:hypothetical protein
MIVAGMAWVPKKVGILSRRKGNVLDFWRLRFDKGRNGWANGGYACSSQIDAP